MQDGRSIRRARLSHAESHVVDGDRVVADHGWRLARLRHEGADAVVGRTRAARIPRIPIAVPRTSDTTVNTRWTAKNPVIPWCHDRESFQMFFRKTGQITQLQTPEAIKNHATRLEMTIVQVSRLAVGSCVERKSPLTYNQMVVLHLSDDEGDRVFQALADATRRDILARARDGQSVSALARHYDMSFAAVQKHVAVLERATLVTKRRRGREQIVQGNEATLRAAAELLGAFEQIWIQRATQIAGILADEDGDIA